MARIEARVGDITNAIWQFGDGGNAFGKDAAVASHAYSAPGNYTVTLTVNTAQGGELVGHMVVRVQNSPPTASGRISPPVGDSTTVFTFVSESTDSDGMISACRWDLGDGNISYSPQVLYSYARHGIYPVSLTVQDDQGNWSTPASYVVTVNNTPPDARLRTDRVPGGAGRKFVFDASGTSDIDDPAGNLSYHWDFGDGSAAEGVNISHTYSSPGDYQAMLTVEDGAGGRSSRSVTVHVTGETAQQAGLLVPAVLAAAAVIAISVLVIAGLFISRKKNGSNPRRESQKNGKRTNSMPARTAPQSINNNKRTSNDRSK
jgi:PKD repeat protein